jgi:malonyl-CoA/methylmalonyl-CoA synthetase
LCNSHPTVELEYFITNSKSDIVIFDDSFKDVLQPIQQSFPEIKFIKLPSIVKKEVNNENDFEFSPNSTSDALIIYTSGTTSRPKGVLTTHEILNAQMEALREPWGWTSKDHLLHCLPLHHVHGILIMLITLSVGGTVDFSKFKEEEIWKKLMQGNVNLFMAVPTIYQKLIKYHEKEIKKDISGEMKKLRLMVSGSASLPDTLFQKWKEITSHTLLERYGMTEIGLVISNPLCGERLMGYVGKPLPGVELKLNSTEENKGELLVKGKTIFKEYFEKPEETKKSFDREGWFKTGDFVEYDPLVDSYKILGRISMDIIKSGGYKISALEIERILLKNPKLHEVCVLGIPDEEWGQRIACLYVGDELEFEEFKNWCKSQLATYKIPSRLKRVDSMERNAMGKINKNNMLKFFE